MRILKGVVVLLLLQAMLGAQEQNTGDVAAATPTHSLNLEANVDVRGWVGPRLSSASSVSGQNLEADGTPRDGRPQAGDLYAGARMTSTWIALNYAYGDYVGATIALNLEGTMSSFRMDSAQSITAGLRHAYGWVDLLGVFNQNQAVGLRLTAGYLNFEPIAGRTSPNWQGSSALKFEMNTDDRLRRAVAIDQLLWRLDLDVNALKTYLDLTFSVTSDLDFSRVNNGWMIMGEVTAAKIKLGSVATFGINVHYHHWQGGDTRGRVDDTWSAPSVSTSHNNFSGRGFFGSHLFGGSTSVAFNLPQTMRLTIGFAGDYQWYFGNYLIQTYEKEFNSVSSNGRIDTYYGHRKGSLAYEVGLELRYPKWFVLWAAYVSRVTSSYGFSHDEGLQGLRPNSFLAIRLDLLMLEDLANLTIFGGVSVGLTEARKEFWGQTGRVGWEVGLSYRPVRSIRIRTGWHMGSYVLGQIAAPANNPSRSKDGHFFLRLEWSLRL